MADLIFPVKVYAILEKGKIGSKSPSTTIQGDTYYLTESDVADWDNKKQAILDDFLGTLWAKGDKDTPSGRPDWKDYVEIRTDKPVEDIEAVASKRKVVSKKGVVVTPTPPPAKVSVEAVPTVEVTPEHLEAAEIPESRVVSPEAQMESSREAVKVVEKGVEQRTKYTTQQRAYNVAVGIATTVKSVTSGIINRIKSLFKFGKSRV